MRVKFVICLLMLSFVAYAETESLAVGYGKLKFAPPVAGSYELKPFATATNGEVLTDEGERKTLYQLFDNKLVVLGFVYLSCGDVNGCPLTTFVVNELKKVIDKTPYLRDNVRLLSLSFDPARDTPEALKNHAGHINARDGVWSLLTTKNDEMLAPILSSYNQPVQKIYDENGKETGEINHILRVFLIDRKKQIRNIYSTDFLHKDILLADLKTLLLAENPHAMFKQLTHNDLSHQQQHQH